MSNFRIGEKVVFVDDSNMICTPAMAKAGVIFPKIGQMYTIRGFVSESIYLEEIKNPKIQTLFGFMEQGFRLIRFRKLDHKFGEDVCAQLIEDAKRETILN